MSNSNAISSIHVKKLGNPIEEIRLRALDNIILKFNLGFGCDCNAIKKELIVKLFNWFTYDNVQCSEKVLDLLYRVVKDNYNYINEFGKKQFLRELREVKTKLGNDWLEKITRIEELVLKSQNSHETISNSNIDCSKVDYDMSHNDFTIPLSLDNTTLLNLNHSNSYENDISISKNLELGGIKWLTMPWQPLVMSDMTVLAAVEEALNNNVDTKLILETCEYLLNVMLQDFPAEVFLQRPSIILILHNLLNISNENGESKLKDIIPIILKTLNKLTHSLRCRIKYYCDPRIANKKQKLLTRNLSSNAHLLTDVRISSDEGMVDHNYQENQSAGSSEACQSVIDQIDESVLQIQQMFIPIYCIETLKHTLMQLNALINPVFPLRNIKYILSLVNELTQLLIDCILPDIWISNNAVAYSVQENLILLFTLIGEILQYFGNSSVDYHKITYLHLICICTNLISSILPLELADAILPKILKEELFTALMDASIYLIYPVLHNTLLQYISQFQGNNSYTNIKCFDEVKSIAKSMKAAIRILKNSGDQLSPIEALKTIYTSKSSLHFHKKMQIIEKSVKLLQIIYRHKLIEEDLSLALKLTLYFLANSDNEIQYKMYIECHNLVNKVLGIQYVKDVSWENIEFLLKTNVLTEIILYGLNNDNHEIQAKAEDIIIYILKGKLHMGEDGWNKTLESIVPVLPLLQCYADSNNTLGQCVTKMFDPDMSNNIKLPKIEVLKGNLRLLFSSESSIREEAICRIIWLLEKEENSHVKLPRLASLHGLPLSSLCIFTSPKIIKKLEGSYQRTNMISVLEMLNESHVDPKMRKSALVQISVMLTDVSLQKLFIAENGLYLILKIFDSALVEKDFNNYPDSVIPIITILKLLSFGENSIRQELSTRSDIFLNIIRSIFLFPNNECVKEDGSQLLCVLLYNEYIIKHVTKNSELSRQMNVSLPFAVIDKMQIPFIAKSHWNTSINRRSNPLVIFGKNEMALKFLKQFWAWEWNDQHAVLWRNYEELNNSEISEKLQITETEFLSMKYIYPPYYCQHQLYDIQNSTTHDGVSCALDYLTMLIKFNEILNSEDIKNINELPWEKTFERYLLSHPICAKDCELFVNIINFVELYINVMKDSTETWINRIIKTVIKSLANFFKTLDMSKQDVYQSILKLAQTWLATIEHKQESNDNNSWIFFIELLVSNLHFGDHQQFYNLAYLDSLLTCLTYLIGKCQWNRHSNLLVTLGNALIELVMSFHGAGITSFKGLSITKNSMICLNHLSHQMQVNFQKNMWVLFWYEEGKSLNWLPVLWHNRDPSVRASALQLLNSLFDAPHAACQLLNAINFSPERLCRTLLQYIKNHTESCIVREQACIGYSKLLKNCISKSSDYNNDFQLNVVLSLVEESNLYYEIGLLCNSVYRFPTLDTSSSISQIAQSAKSQNTLSTASGCMSNIQQAIAYLYNCHDDLQSFSVKDSEGNELDHCVQFIATPMLLVAACRLLNNLIYAGQREVIQVMYNHSLDKCLFGCFTGMPKDTKEKEELIFYYDILKMYISVCTTLSTYITYNKRFVPVIALFTDSIHLLTTLLDINLYKVDTPVLLCLRNKLWTAIFNLISTFYLLETDHSETIQIALNNSDLKTIFIAICIAIKENSIELRRSATSCLSIILEQEIKNEDLTKCNNRSREVLDMKLNFTELFDKKTNLKTVLSNVNKLVVNNLNTNSRRFNGSDNEGEKNSSDILNEERQTIGTELCDILSYNFIAHHYTKSKKSSKQKEDKDIVIGALSNLLCVSKTAKKLAIEEDLSSNIIIILQELYVQLNLQPMAIYSVRYDNDKKIHPLLSDINNISILLMNFMHNSTQSKKILSKQSLANIMHKLWEWITTNKVVLKSTLKMLTTFTANCPEASQSLTLTTTLPGVGMRKTPNTVALIHVVIQLICKEIKNAGKTLDGQKLNFAFQILRNSVRVHECRVSISKSNLLQNLSTIHPLTTRRAKPWPLVELYFLEFLIDFTYFEEGQLCVPKIADAISVLISLARTPLSSTRVLAISTLRNLTFNTTNRSRFLNSVDFINLLHDVFKGGTVDEIEIAGSILWSLVSNNQKGKLIVRSAGFTQDIQESLSKLALLNIDGRTQEEDTIRMLQYVIHILNPNN